MDYRESADFVVAVTGSASKRGRKTEMP